MQHDIFLQGEANNWYKRNKADVEQDYEGDPMLKYLRTTSIEGKTVLDIGCGNGHRLSQLEGAIRYGIEPSSEAVKRGNENPKLQLFEGVSHDLSRFSEQSMDIVTMAFVFHWVDRSKLFQTINEIDRVLKDDGTLAIMDFYPEHPHKRLYHYLPESGVYTYKQVWADVFTASLNYIETYRVPFLCPDASHHQWDRQDASLTGGDKQGLLTILKKECVVPLKEGVLNQFTI